MLVLEDVRGTGEALKAAAAAADNQFELLPKGVVGNDCSLIGAVVIVVAN